QGPVDLDVGDLHGIVEAGGVECVQSLQGDDARLVENSTEGFLGQLAGPREVALAVPVAEQKAADVVLLGPRDVEELLIEGTESFLRCEVERSVRHPLERLERDSAESFEVLPNIGYGARLGPGHVACPPWPERVAPRLSAAPGPRTIVDHARGNRGRAGGDRP